MRVLRGADPPRGPGGARDGLPARPGQVQPPQEVLGIRRLPGGPAAEFPRSGAALRVLRGHDTGIAAAGTPDTMQLNLTFFKGLLSRFVVSCGVGGRLQRLYES